MGFSSFDSDFIKRISYRKSYNYELNSPDHDMATYTKSQLNTEPNFYLKAFCT